MSMTVSRGLQRISNWSGVAASVAEYLEQSTAGTHQEARIPRGAIRALQQFFEAVLEGEAIGRRERTRDDIPPMAGICCYAIASEVLTSIRGIEPSSKEVASRAQAHLETLRILQQGGQPKNTAHGLFEFATHMMRLGLADRSMGD